MMSVTTIIALGFSRVNEAKELVNWHKISLQFHISLLMVYNVHYRQTRKESLAMPEGSRETSHTVATTTTVVFIFDSRFCSESSHNITGWMCQPILLGCLISSAGHPTD